MDGIFLKTFNNLIFMYNKSQIMTNDKVKDYGKHTVL